MRNSHNQVTDYFERMHTDNEKAYDDMTHTEYAHNRRVHTHEHNCDNDNLDVYNYKGIYYNEETNDNEKNHCEITGAHFKYEDACKKLLTHLEKTQRNDSSDKRHNTEPNQNLAHKKLSDVAKVKIILNYNKKPTISKSRIP